MEIPSKIDLEELAGISLRRGFDKLIPAAIKYFNYEEIKKEEALSIINFINKSNTTLHESYWILRKKFTLEQSEIELKKQCKSFVESSYKHTNRSTVAKKFIGVNKSRGYSGWIELNSKKFYCRSQYEFVIINYLNKIYDKEYTIEYEHSIFHISSKKAYKPDFFIFKNNVLEKIIEVKSSKEFFLTKEFKEIQSFFKKNNIEYEVLYDISFILKTYPDIKNNLEIWKKSAFIERDMRGENNPSFGIKCSDERKRKISEKAKSRCIDSKYKENIRDKVKLTSLLKFIKETDCSFKYNIVKNETGEEFYYILNDSSEIIYPRGFYRVKNIKNLIENENKNN